MQALHPPTPPAPEHTRLIILGGSASRDLGDLGFLLTSTTHVRSLALAQNLVIVRSRTRFT